MEDNKAAPSAPPQGGGAFGAAPLGFVVVFLLRISSETSGFLIGLSLENKLAHNKRPEGSSKPTRVATNPGLRQYVCCCLVLPEEAHWTQFRHDTQAVKSK